MSVSPDHTAINLYCSESASGVVSSNTRTSCQCISRTTFGSPVDEESSIAHMFDSENDQMQRHEFFRGVLNSDEIVTARCNAIDWMLKVHAYHKLRYETAYLSVNYLDCFLRSRPMLEGQQWQWQLLSVACLSLAAKMEEAKVPLLLELQVMEPEFVFKPKTVQRMELLVMASLTWRLRIVTPFDFVDYFTRKAQCASDAQVHQLCCISAVVSDLILRTCRVIDFQGHKPSAIAAAAVLCTIGRSSRDPNTFILHERVSKDAVRRCQLLFEEILRIKCNKIYSTQKYLPWTPSQTETKLPTKQ